MQSVEASVMRVKSLVACICSCVADGAFDTCEALASKGGNAVVAYDGRPQPDFLRQ